MGIRGLSSYLKWNTPHLYREVQWEHHYGETWGIDCSCMMYRARAAGLSILTVLAKFFVQMKRYSITPIVIFDGRPPSSKDSILEERRNQRTSALSEIQALTSEMGTPISKIQRAFMEKRMMGLRCQSPQITTKEKDDVKQFLYSAGILFMTATGEADDVLAYLSREQTIQAIVSTDMDMLPRGVKTLILPQTRDASVVKEIHTSDVLQSLDLTYSQFVDACVMMGSDYADKDWKTITPELAIEIARVRQSWNSVCFNKDVLTHLQRGASSLRGDTQTWESIFSESQQKKWMSGTPPPEPDTLKRLCNEHGWPQDWLTVLSSPISLLPTPW